MKETPTPIVTDNITPKEAAKEAIAEAFKPKAKGRPKGSKNKKPKVNPEDEKVVRTRGPNKSTTLARDRVAHYQNKHKGFMGPLDFLLLTMNGLDSQEKPIKVDIKDRIRCGAQAIQYTNPKLSAIEIELETEESPDITTVMNRVKELLEKTKGDK